MLKALGFSSWGKREGKNTKKRLICFLSFSLYKDGEVWRAATCKQMPLMSHCRPLPHSTPGWLFASVSGWRHISVNISITSISDGETAKFYPKVHLFPLSYNKTSILIGCASHRFLSGDAHEPCLASGLYRPELPMSLLKLQWHRIKTNILSILSTLQYV